jgi:hypothetical protein
LSAVAGPFRNFRAAFLASQNYDPLVEPMKTSQLVSFDFQVRKTLDDEPETFF